MQKRKNKKLSKEEEQEILDSINKKSSNNVISNIYIDIKCKNENQKKFMNLIKEKEITIAAGFAGTGKTFISCAESLKLIKNNDNKYHKIIIIKSVTSLKNEEIGWIKGSVKDKMEPFMFSFMSIFNKIIGKDATDRLEAMGILQVLPLAYARGLTFDNSIIIIDEAQNISLDNMKTILTRIGENSKMIIIGDTKQVDLKNKKESSLSKIIEKFQKIPDFGIINFEKTDQVRNPLINIIEDVFDDLEK